MKSDRLLDAIGFINDEAVWDAKAYRNSKPHYGTKLFMIVAAIVLLTTTAMAAVWAFLRAAEIPERLNNYTLSDAFDSDKAININASVTSGEYIFTLLAIVSGDGISDYFGSAMERQPERTYVVLAIQNADRSPIQKEDLFDLTNNFMVTPLIRGVEPWVVNAASMGGSFSDSLMDGVLYRLVECDSIMMFADRGLYLGVCSEPIISRETFQFNEATGEITVNPDYPGASAVFDLPVDASYAGPERAEQYLERFYEEMELSDAPPVSEDDTP